MSRKKLTKENRLTARKELKSEKKSKDKEAESILTTMVVRGL